MTNKRVPSRILMRTKKALFYIWRWLRYLHWKIIERLESGNPRASLFYLFNVYSFHHRQNKSRKHTCIGFCCCHVIEMLCRKISIVLAWQIYNVSFCVIFTSFNSNPTYSAFTFSLYAQEVIRFLSRFSPWTHCWTNQSL